MKAKKILALLLSVLMVAALFAACSNTENSNGGGNSGSPDNSSSPGNSGNSGSPGNSGEEEDEPIEIIYYGLQWQEFNTGAGTVAAQLEDAINEITMRELNVHINFNWLKFSDFSSQVTLALSNKEQIDLCSYNFALQMPVIYSKGMAMDITDLLKEHARETLDLEGWLMDIVTYGGRTYGVPAYRVLSQGIYAIFRTDKLEACGMVEAAQNMKTWTEYEAVLTALRDSGISPLGCSGGKGALWNTIWLKNGDTFSSTIVRDNLGDTLGVLNATNDRVVSNFEDSRVVDGFKMIADWSAKGLIWPDSPYSLEGDKTLLGMAAFAALQNGSEIGVESNYGQSVGTPVTANKLFDGICNGAGASGIGAFVPITAQEPEAAVKLINLIWNSRELMNMWSWGLEGVTYVVKDGVCTFPEGVDAGSSGYRQNDWGWGNQFLVTPWEPSPANFRELALEDFRNAPKSQYLGFAADLSEYDGLVSALSAVRDEYIVALGTGLYTDEMYNEFLTKLDAAGLADYIQIFQTQLNDYMG